MDSNNSEATGHANTSDVEQASYTNPPSKARASRVQQHFAYSNLIPALSIGLSSTTGQPLGHGEEALTSSKQIVEVGFKYSNVQTIF